MVLREFYDSIGSTQERATALARAGAREGTRVVARRQTAGRGRLDRSWVSPVGGLYCSIVLTRPAEHPGLLPLTVGARLGEALRARFAIPVTVKWPNDLLVRERGRSVRKLSGILTDEVSSPTLGRAVVVGVGLNVRLARELVPEHLRARVASLDEFVSPPPGLDDVEEVVAGAAMEASEWLATTAGVRNARALCGRLLYGVGKPVSVDGRPAGTIAGLGDEGQLWVTTDTDRVAIWAGDVRVEEAP